jgi:hypothetical protein
VAQVTTHMRGTTNYSHERAERVTRNKGVLRVTQGTLRVTRAREVTQGTLRVTRAREVTGEGVL